MSAAGQNRKCADLAVSQKRRLCDVWGMALLSRIPRFPILGILEIGGIDAKSRSQELSEKAAEERRRRRDWLLPFMQNSQPKTAWQKRTCVARHCTRSTSRKRMTIEMARWCDEGATLPSMPGRAGQNTGAEGL